MPFEEVLKFLRDELGLKNKEGKTMPPMDEKGNIVEQVRLILLQRDNYRAVLGDLGRVLDAAAEKEAELVTRISSTKTALSTLGTQKEIARIQELTAKSDDLLAKVNELLGENREAIQELTTPVRTVEELLGSAAEAAPAKDGEVDALSFLKARE